MHPEPLLCTPVSFSRYAEALHEPYHAYNAAAFSEANAHKCESVHPLLFHDTKSRLGIIGGVKDGLFQSPFSAPYGGFSFARQNVHFPVMERATELLEEYVRGLGLRGIRLVLPPLAYNRVFLSKLMNVLYRAGYSISNIDLDFYIELQHPVPYEERMWYNARKNLHQSRQQPFRMVQCNGQSADRELVYRIIAENRRAKQKPMHMSLEEVLLTATLIPADFFLLYLQEEPVASALVFESAPGIRYVTHWGDLPGYSQHRPVNFLSHYLVEHYAKEGLQYLHIGIGTEDSVPNYGLCEFKESIGCTLTPKLSFEKQWT
ncbi:MAG TPA: GNAT family N-acetyltransferase [Lacibacter sp.]|nr:GNAT family N-acetyltransferase [Lacibacter sp.]HMO88512.1 GNAT family N-acetyltransferase [Lacibacter sp.]HMP88077.1 GNAT family N-acetyltransferase [Lacibacter sp.]